MSTKLITVRPYRGEADLQLLVDLEVSVSTTQLRMEIEAPGVDLDRDLRLWEDAAGKVIGFGGLSIAEPTQNNLAEGTLEITVHPLARDGDLDSQIITWAEKRMHEVGKERQGQPKLLAWCRNSRVDRIAMLEQHGFVEGRQYWYLSQSLTQAIPSSPLPEDFRIRAVDGEREAQAWVDLHNRAFASAWIYHPLTVESYKHRLQNPDYLPELDLVTVDRDGKFAAICYCKIDTAHNQAIGRQEGWIVLLFTSPNFQRRGLARAMLFHALNKLKSLGIEIVNIGVDSQNAFGARQLYESIGFKHIYTNIAYVKHL